MPTIPVLPLTGPFAITFDDGEAVAAAIDAVDTGVESVTLDFTGVQIYGAVFWNALVGPLVGTNPSGDRWQRVLIANLPSDLDRRILDRVIENQYECRDVPGKREAIERAIARVFADD